MSLESLATEARAILELLNTYEERQNEVNEMHATITERTKAQHAAQVQALEKGGKKSPGLDASIATLTDKTKQLEQALPDFKQRIENRGRELKRRALKEVEAIVHKRGGEYREKAQRLEKAAREAIEAFHNHVGIRKWRNFMAGEVAAMDANPLRMKEDSLENINLFEQMAVKWIGAQEIASGLLEMLQMPEAKG